MNIAIATAAFKAAQGLMDYDFGLALDVAKATDQELAEFTLYLRADLNLLTRKVLDS